MSRTTKLILDIVIGAVIPILILNNLSKPLGAPTAYVIAALIPVAWVFIDLFAITRRFNFITSYVGLTAVINGALAFWFVDGLRYALKDTAGVFVSVLIFGGSLLVGKPIILYFLKQTLNPDTPKREQSLDELIGAPSVRRSLVLGTVIITIATAITGTINIFLNLTNVTAAFGTDAFNQQVAYVNAISRILYPLLSFVSFGVALWFIYRALYMQLPSEEGKSQLESDFWELVELRAVTTGDEVML
ncbi:MAG TPA: VC0807 family protein [Roseiflexaceae bacterium]|jgi:hypothetical protein|nr:VC0807 family protein [Roseiflexaceae bacterium]